MHLYELKFEHYGKDGEVEIEGRVTVRAETLTKAIGIVSLLGRWRSADKEHADPIPLVAVTRVVEP